MKKAISIIENLGFIGFLIFTAALDGTNNNMTVVYSGLIMSGIALFTGMLLEKKE